MTTKWATLPRRVLQNVSAGRRRQAHRPEPVAPSAVRLDVNGTVWRGTVDPAETLLQTLRARMSLTGAKPACERGECGACTVLIAGAPRMACITPVLTVDAPVVTVEGLVEESGPLRAAMADSGGFQCGYCTPGQVVSAMAILLDDRAVSEPEVRARMAGNICRCTGYTPIVEAIMAVARGRGAS